MSYLFVDAAYLRSELASACSIVLAREVQDVDFGVLGDGFRKIFFYEAPPPPREGEADERYRSRVEQWFESAIVPIARLPRFHVTNGWTKRTRRRGPVQKAVDVALAVDLVMSSHNQQVADIALLAGDADFVPAVEAAVALGTNVTVLGRPGSTSRELILAADVFAPFSTDLFRRLLAPTAPMDQFPAHGRLTPVRRFDRVLAEGTVRGVAVQLCEEVAGKRFVAQWLEDRSGAQDYISGPSEAAVKGAASYFFGVQWV